MKSKKMSLISAGKETTTKQTKGNHHENQSGR
jgi:hypothetical protein